MFAAMIFTIAMLALCQFALFYWRAVVSGVASLPVSDRVLEAAHLDSGEFCGADFERLASLHGMTPELDGGNSKLGLIKVYYGAEGFWHRIRKNITGNKQLDGTRKRAVCALCGGAN